MADSDVISKLLEHQNLNNAVILCHDTTALVSIFNNVRKMVKPEKFTDLITYKKVQFEPSAPQHNLFFAVEHPKPEKKKEV